MGFIAEASESYRYTANRGALLFFLMLDLCRIHSFYMYSLAAFLIVVRRAINKVEEGKLQITMKEEKPEEKEEKPEEKEEKPEEEKKEDEGEGEEKKEGEGDGEEKKEGEG